MKGILLVFLLLASLALVGAKPQATVLLEATDDAYVVTDASTTDDPQGLRDQKFGTLDFIKVWYAWKVTGEEQLLSVGTARFDLSSLQGKEVQSATLQLFALRADLEQPARLVDVHESADQWSEKDVTFNTKPAWSAQPVATSAVYGAGVWYSWDVSGSVAQMAKKGRTASYVLGLRAVDDKKEEQVVFASREVGQNGPRLLVTYKASPLLGQWYVWTAGIVVAALVAFAAGWWLSRRRRAARQQDRGEAAAPSA